MIDPIEQQIDIPPASPTGLYDASFQTKVINILAWFTTMVTQFTTLIEKLNVFATQVNNTVPLINNGLPVGDYEGSASNTFLVADGSATNHAVNKGQLDTKLTSDPTGVTGAIAVGNTFRISQADYDALDPKDADTFYIIV